MEESDIEELRQCAWIAWMGYKCCYLSERLVELQIENHFFVDIQQNAYMNATLWWVSLLGSKSPTYQKNVNFKRDIRCVCNKHSAIHPDFSGENIDSKVMLSVGINQSEYEEFREAILESRHNRFAHVNPQKIIMADSMEKAIKMFICCKNTVINLLEDEMLINESIKTEIAHTIRTINHFFKQPPVDYEEVLNSFKTK